MTNNDVDKNGSGRQASQVATPFQGWAGAFLSANDTGNVFNNIFTVSSPSLLGSGWGIYGGLNLGRGNATENTLYLHALSNMYTFGGYAANGSAINNTVVLDGVNNTGTSYNSANAIIYGGGNNGTTYASNAADRDVVTGNTLVIKQKDNNVYYVGNFEKLNFDLSGIHSGDTMLTVNGGFQGNTVDWKNISLTGAEAWARDAVRANRSNQVTLFAGSLPLTSYDPQATGNTFFDGNNGYEYGMRSNSTQTGTTTSAQLYFNADQFRGADVTLQLNGGTTPATLADNIDPVTSRPFIWAGRSELGNDATNNTMTIQGNGYVPSSWNVVSGWAKGLTGDANNNTLKLIGGSEVYDAWAMAGYSMHGNATGNTVILDGTYGNGSPNNAYVTGGMGPDASKDYITNNTLQVNSAKNSVAGISNFDHLKFILSNQINNNDTMLTDTGYANKVPVWGGNWGSALTFAWNNIAVESDSGADKGLSWVLAGMGQGHPSRMVNLYVGPTINLTGYDPSGTKNNFYTDANGRTVQDASNAINGYEYGIRSNATQSGDVTATQLYFNTDQFKGASFTQNMNGGTAPTALPDNSSRYNNQPAIWAGRSELGNDVTNNVLTLDGNGYLGNSSYAIGGFAAGLTGNATHNEVVLKNGAETYSAYAVGGYTLNGDATDNTVTLDGSYNQWGQSWIAGGASPNNGHELVKNNTVQVESARNVVSYMLNFDHMKYLLNDQIKNGDTMLTAGNAGIVPYWGSNITDALTFDWSNISADSQGTTDGGKAWVDAGTGSRQVTLYTGASINLKNYDPVQTGKSFYSNDKTKGYEYGIRSNATQTGDTSATQLYFNTDQFKGANVTQNINGGTTPTALPDNSIRFNSQTAIWAGRSELGNDVTNNVLTLDGNGYLGTYIYAIGGFAAGLKGNATNNEVILKNGAETNQGYAVGGYALNGDATDNTVTLDGSYNQWSQSWIAGGASPNNGHELVRNNTIQVESAGNAVSYMLNFDHMKYLLNDQIKSGDTMLTAGNAGIAPYWGSNITDALTFDWSNISADSQGTTDGGKAWVDAGTGSRQVTLYTGPSIKLKNYDPVKTGKTFYSDNNTKGYEYGIRSNATQSGDVTATQLYFNTDQFKGADVTFKINGGTGLPSTLPDPITPYAGGQFYSIWAGRSELGNDVTNNVLRLSGNGYLSTYNYAIGGLAKGLKGNARNNEVILEGGAEVNQGDAVGGYALHGDATDNTVTLNGSYNQWAYNYLLGGASPESGHDVLSNNTLKVESAGNAASGVYNFDHMDFVLNNQIQSGNTMLSTSGAGYVPVWGQGVTDSLTFDWPHNVAVDNPSLISWVEANRNQNILRPTVNLYNGAMIYLTHYAPRFVGATGNFEFGKEAFYGGTPVTPTIGDAKAPATSLTIANSQFQFAGENPQGTPTWIRTSNDVRTNQPTTFAGKSLYGSTTNHNALMVDSDVSNYTDPARAGWTSGVYGGSDDNTLEITKETNQDGSIKTRPDGSQVLGVVKNAFAGWTHGTQLMPHDDVQPWYVDPAKDENPTGHADAARNRLILNGGTILAGGKVFAGYIATNTDLQTTSDGTARENTTSLESGTVGDNATIGAGSTEGTGNVSANTLQVTGGTFGANVSLYGGYTQNAGDADSNIANIFGGTFTNGTKVYAGFANTGTARNNQANLTNSTLTGDAYGGYSTQGDASGNITTVTNATATNVYGGSSPHGKANGNTTTVTNNSHTADVYGGFAPTGDANGNAVSVQSGATAHNVYAAFGQNARGNTLTLDGGAVTGAFDSAHASGDAIGNTLNIASGTVTGDVHAGYAGGEARGNGVNLSGGTVNGNVYGGFSTGGTATGNNVNLSGRSVNVTGTIYGGNQANALGNTLNVSGNSDAGNVQNFSTYQFNLNNGLDTSRAMLTLHHDTSLDWNAVLANAGNFSGSDMTLLDDAQGLNLQNYTGAKGVGDSHETDNSERVIERAGTLAGHDATRIVYHGYDFNHGNTPHVSDELDIWAGRSVIGNATRDNHLTVPTDRAYRNAYGGWTQGTGSQRSDRFASANNSVTLNNGGQVQNLYGGRTESGGNATENTATITGGQVANNVYGGASDVGNAMHNVVNLQGGAIGGNVYGGFGAGTTINNTINFSGGTVAGTIYGGSQQATGNVLNLYGNTAAENIQNFSAYDFHFNSAMQPASPMLSLTGNGSTLDWNAIQMEGTAPASHITLVHNANGLTLNHYQHARLISVDGNNERLLDAGTTNGRVTDVVYTGYAFRNSSQSDANDGNIWAGRSVIGNTTTNNHLTMSGGTYNNAYGGWTAGTGTTNAAQNDSTNNTATLANGTVQNLFGGRTESGGSATNNTATVAGGTVTNVYGGFTNGANATGNTVHLLGGTVLGDVYGGVGNGATMNNQVILDGSTVRGTLHGGSNGETNNMLRIRVNSTAGNVQNFDTAYFNFDRLSEKTPLLTLNGGQPTVLRWNSQIKWGPNDWRPIQTHDAAPDEQMVVLENASGIDLQGTYQHPAQIDTDGNNEYTLTAMTPNANGLPTQIVYHGHTFKNSQRTTPYVSAENNAYAGRSEIGNSTANNSLTLIGGNYHNAYGGWTIGTGTSADDRNDSRENVVNFQNGTVQNLFGGSTESGGNATNNTATLSGGHVTSNVYGGFTNGANATGNTVKLNSGLVNGDVFGGYANGTTTGNTVNIGNVTVQGTVYGGNGNNASGNTLNISGNAVAGNVQNFDSFTFNINDANRNSPLLTLTNGNATPLVWSAMHTPTVTIANGSFSGSVDLLSNQAGLDFTGYTGPRSAIANIGNGVIGEFDMDTNTHQAHATSLEYRAYATQNNHNPRPLPEGYQPGKELDIWSGRSRVGGSTKNDTLALNDQNTLDDQGNRIHYRDAYGGWTAGTGTSATGDERGNTRGNSVAMNGSQVGVRNLYGGVTEEATGSATDNSATLSQGTVANNVYGAAIKPYAETATGDATGNRASVSGGKANNVYGLAVEGNTTGKVADNHASISGGIINNIYGAAVAGDSTTGDVTDNQASMYSGTINNIYGAALTGKNTKGNATGNHALVNIGNTSGLQVQNVYGAAIGDTTEATSNATGNANGNTVTFVGGHIAHDVFGGWTNGSGQTRANVVNLGQLQSQNPRYARFALNNRFAGISSAPNALIDGSIYGGNREATENVLSINANNTRTKAQTIRNFARELFTLDSTVKDNDVLLTLTQNTNLNYDTIEAFNGNTISDWLGTRMQKTAHLIQMDGANLHLDGIAKYRQTADGGIEYTLSTDNKQQNTTGTLDASVYHWQNANVIVHDGTEKRVFGGKSVIDRTNQNALTLQDNANVNEAVAGDTQTQSGVSTNNTLYMRGNNVQVGNAYGGRTSGSGAAEANHIVLDSGTATNLYGGFSNAGNATGNTVTLNSGTVHGDVYGGFSNGNGTTTNNTVTLNGGAVHGVLHGGNRGETGNTLNINVNSVAGNVQNFDTAAFDFSKLNAQTPLLLLNNGQTTQLRWRSGIEWNQNWKQHLHTQGVAPAEQMTVLENDSGIDFGGSYHGVNDNAEVDTDGNNEYILAPDGRTADGTMPTKIVYRGHSFKDVHKTEPYVDNAQNAYAGRSEIGNTTRDNTLTVSGGGFVNAYGGWTSGRRTSGSDKFNSVHNIITQNGGAVDNLYGGRTESDGGKATNNEAHVNGGAATNVFGGYADKGDATDNKVFINSYAISGDVFGGYAGGHTTGNEVYFNAGQVDGTIYGGNKEEQGNKLYLNNKGLTAGTVKNFEKIYFALNSNINPGDNPFLQLKLNTTLRYNQIETSGEASNVASWLGAGTMQKGAPLIHMQGSSQLTMQGDARDSTVKRVGDVEYKLAANGPQELDLTAYHWQGANIIVDSDVTGQNGGKVFGGQSYAGQDGNTNANQLTLQNKAKVMEAIAGDTQTPMGATTNNVLTINKGEVTTAIAGHAQQGAATGNQVEMHNGTVQTLKGAETNGDAEGNFVTVDGGTVTDVIGADAKGKAVKNTVLLSKVQVQNVYGVKNSKDAHDNTVTLDGTTVQGEVQAAPEKSGSGNTAILKNGANVKGNVTADVVRMNVPEDTKHAESTDENKVHVGGDVHVASEANVQNADIQGSMQAQGAKTVTLDQGAEVQKDINADGSTTTVQGASKVRGNVTAKEANVQGQGTTVDKEVRAENATISDHAQVGSVSATDTATVTKAKVTGKVAAEKTVNLKDSAEVGSVDASHGVANVQEHSTVNETLNAKKALIDDATVGDIANTDEATLQNQAHVLRDAQIHHATLDHAAIDGNLNADLADFTAAQVGKAIHADTLNIHATDAGASSAGSLDNVKNLFFYVESAPEKYMETLTQPAQTSMLNITANKVQDIRSYNLGIGVNPKINTIQKGDVLSLLKVKDGTLLTDPLPLRNKIPVDAKTVSRRYRFSIEPQGNNELIAVTTYAGSNESLKSLLETRAGLADFVNRGADIIDSVGMESAESVAHQNAHYSIWAGTTRSDQTSYTGSSIDTKGWHFAMGWAGADTLGTVSRTYGPFFEYGQGSYHSSIEDGTKGSGKMSYLGAGYLFRARKANGEYFEGAVHGGRTLSDYEGVVDSRHVTSYETSGAYYAAHITLGKNVDMGAGDHVDGYLKYFYSHQASMKAQVNTNAIRESDTYDFDAVDSSRVRLGTRYTKELNKENIFYTGLAFEYEFAGKASGSFEYGSIPTPKLRGGSELVEMGYRFQPKNSRFSCDLNLTAWQGKREGFMGSAHFNWAFN